MRTCVIGGGGFLGSYIVPELLRSGRDVVVLGRRSTPPIGIDSLAQYVMCDYSCRESLRSVLSDCNEVIDLAYSTVPKTSFSDPVFDLQSNLPATVGLLEEVRNLDKLRCLLFVSSGGTVYGPANSLPITEESPNNPVSPYGITKLTVERYALMYHLLHNVPSMIVRPANAYGVGQRPFVGQGFIATAMGAIIQRKPVTIFGENGTVRDYVHASDVARGVLAALNYGTVGQVYNIGSGVGRNNRQVLDFIAPLAESDGFNVSVEVEAPRSFDVPVNILNFGRLLACSGWLPQVSFEDGIADMWRAISK